MGCGSCSGEGICSGACCAVFEFLDPESPAWNDNTIGPEPDFLRDMLIPLDLVTAAERMEKFGIAYWADKAVHDWEGKSTLPGHEGRRLMTCKHWNEETGLCGAYDERPMMCREYPYYASDCDYHCGYSLTFQEKWDRALRLNGPEGGTPDNIVRGYN